MCGGREELVTQDGGFEKQGLKEIERDQIRTGPSAQILSTGNENNMMVFKWESRERRMSRLYIVTLLI